MFEISINKEAASIEIRSVECVNVDEVLYDEMSVSPRSANSITVSLLPIKRFCS